MKKLFLIFAVFLLLTGCNSSPEPDGPKVDNTRFELVSHERSPRDSWLSLTVIKDKTNGKSFLLTKYQGEGIHVLEIKEDSNAGY